MAITELIYHIISITFAATMFHVTVTHQNEIISLLFKIFYKGAGIYAMLYSGIKIFQYLNII